MAVRVCIWLLVEVIGDPGMLFWGRRGCDSMLATGRVGSFEVDSWTES